MTVAPLLTLIVRSSGALDLTTCSSGSVGLSFDDHSNLYFFNPGYLESGARAKIAAVMGLESFEIRFINAQSSL